MGRKRKNGEGTVRLREDECWEGRVAIGYDDKGLAKTKNVLAGSKAGWRCGTSTPMLQAICSGRLPPEFPQGNPPNHILTFPVECV